VTLTKFQSLVPVRRARNGQERLAALWFRLRSRGPSRREGTTTVDCVEFGAARNFGAFVQIKITDAFSNDAQGSMKL
jgi:hypothetical protein